MARSGGRLPPQPSLAPAPSPSTLALLAPAPPPPTFTPRPYQAGGLFGVFDGHGRLGETVAQYVIDTLPAVLAAHPLIHSQPGTALEDAFQSVDKRLASHCDAGVSGTTAVVALVRGNRMWLANAGDSRAILCRQKHTSSGKSMSYGPVDLTTDHKPDSPDEKRRILQMGGHVTPAGANGAPARVWHKLRGLAMSRSIGDHNAASVGVISKPEITEHEIGDDDVALVLISDGVSAPQQGQSAAPNWSCPSSNRPCPSSPPPPLPPRGAPASTARGWEGPSHYGSTR